MLRKQRPITPKQFALRMKKIAADCDRESRHSNADDLMCNLLRDLGYGEGVETFDAMGKWYA